MGPLIHSCYTKAMKILTIIFLLFLSFPLMAFVPENVARTALMSQKSLSKKWNKKVVLHMDFKHELLEIEEKNFIALIQYVTKILEKEKNPFSAIHFLVGKGAVETKKEGNHLKVFMKLSHTPKKDEVLKSIKALK